MDKGRVGIVCCSNAQRYSCEADIDRLKDMLEAIGLTVVFSEYIYSKNSFFSGTGKERADFLMSLFADEDVTAIYDISGGDIANELLPYLDYDVIAKSGKMLWGYSDLTTILNAIYAKTSAKSVLYQVKNIVWDKSERQYLEYKNYISGKNDLLFSFSYKFIRGNYMSGVVVGGNIRCLLKLAGTEYFPDMHNKILLLEALSGTTPQMVTYLSQLSQLGVFDIINGILLGTFTTMEEESSEYPIAELVTNYVNSDIPIAKTYEIGHGTDSKAIMIGEELSLRA